MDTEYPVLGSKEQQIVYWEEDIDGAVIGGGHAGCEAALACARLGMRTILFAMNLDSIAMMPCNPNIGGTSKGHLVREIDALGGEMGKNIDRTYIQSRMLNTAKGPAVHSLRAQADKARYKEAMKLVLEKQDSLWIRQSEVVYIDTKNGSVSGVLTAPGGYYPCKSVIICTGTYLQASCIHGTYRVQTGPGGMQAACGGLTDCLRDLGLPLRRFKTGTPARVDGRTLDFQKMEEQKGDEHIVPFSFENSPDAIRRPQRSCWLTYTNERTHAIIRNNLHRSPLYSGDIRGIGPRYCPSIEDKVVRFADKERHQVFLEPEGDHTFEYYVSGMSSSLPEDVQRDMLRTLPGLEHVQIMRTGYAIEYDCIDPLALDHTLQIKQVKGLYSAGQFNGSSGYEEAAAQGLIAGINVALSIKGGDPLILDRSQAYIGVLIDDLVTKGTNEPYRMMTSRAEYRLLLRQDNADLRLTELGYKVGLISHARYSRFLRKKEEISQEIERLENTCLSASAEVNEFLNSLKTSSIRSGVSLAELLRRPEISYGDVIAMGDLAAIERPHLDSAAGEQAAIQIKYQGYIEKQMQQVEQFKKLEQKLIPQELNYEEIPSLRLEARQKLSKVRPRSVGQASRISGVSPADVNVLLVYLEQYRLCKK